MRSSPADHNALLDLVETRCSDPFAILGPHRTDEKWTVTVFRPDARVVAILDASGTVLAEAEQIHHDGVYRVEMDDHPGAYQVQLEDDRGRRVEDDPYRFPPVLGELDEYLLAEGRHLELWSRLGCHPRTIEGREGFAFCVWAPNARRVSVVGDFNGWDGRRHPMRRRLGGGVWELFIPGLKAGALYKYEILGSHGALLPLKADPLAFAQELPPGTASIVRGPVEPGGHAGNGGTQRNAVDAPISIYEMHLGSWRRGGGDETLDYDAIGDLLIPYVTEMGFTHVEFMPVSEHPFAGSWGYQPIGLFAPTSRFGTPEQFARLVDRLHEASIGAIVDWVPAHFPSDAYGLQRFDGTALYEHDDPRLGFHRDWNTLIYNYGRREVANFLGASALYWLDRFRIDGLRVDAVASMLYLDYSRNAGEWIPNRYGGNENLDAIDFIRSTNAEVASRHPGSLMIAEESTSWPGVSKPTDEGGLGYDFKWNMGWMHDTLGYMAQDPIDRRHHHHKLTFGLVYAWSEKFILPISHDEVVHGKGSLLNKMPGDRWQKFANLRAYLGFMWAHPGKKLLFMGSEFGQEREWNHDRSLDWHLLDDPMHAGTQRWVAALNRLYRSIPAMHELDTDPTGFEWVEADDADASVFSFMRKDRNGRPVLVVCNMTPVVRESYPVGVSLANPWKLVLSSDDPSFGGSALVSQKRYLPEEPGWNFRPYALRVTLPSLSTVFLEPEFT